jgi:hypothetical protein
MYERIWSSNICINMCVHIYILILFMHYVVHSAKSNEIKALVKETLHFEAQFISLDMNLPVKITYLNNRIGLDRVVNNAHLHIQI